MKTAGWVDLEGLEKSVDFLRPLLLEDQQDVIAPRA